MENEELLLILNTAISKNNNEQQNSYYLLFQYIAQNPYNFLEKCLFFLKNEAVNDNSKILIIYLLKNIFLENQIINSQILLNYSNDILQTIISLFIKFPLHAGALAATITIFIYNNINADIIPNMIKNIFQLYNSLDFLRGTYEYLIDLFMNIEIDQNVAGSVYNFILAHLNLSIPDDITIEGIFLLSILFKFQFITSNLDMIFSSLFHLLDTTSSDKLFSYIYECFYSLLKYNNIEIDDIFIISIQSRIIQDLENISTFKKYFNIYYLAKTLKILVKMNYLVSYDRIIPLIYNIFISHQKIDIDLDEDYDNSISSFSIIEEIIYHNRFEMKLYFLKNKFINFDSRQPQVIELSFRILSSLIITSSFTLEEINTIIQLVIKNLSNENMRIREAVLWTLHSICLVDYFPLNYIYDLSFKTLNYYIKYSPNNDEINNFVILSAISYEILSLFASHNICNQIHNIFQILLERLIQTRNSFLYIRLDKLLSKIAEKINPIFIIECINNYFLNKINGNKYTWNSIYAILDSSMKNDSSIQLIEKHDIITFLLKNINKKSIFTLTKFLLKSNNKDDYSYLIDLFNRYPKISISSIILYSIEQCDFSLFSQYWNLVKDKISVIKQITQKNDVDYFYKISYQIQIFMEIYESTYFCEFLSLIDIIISNTINEETEKWIYFGMQIIIQKLSIFNQEYQQISFKETKKIISFLETVAGSSLEYFINIINKGDYIILKAFLHHLNETQNSEISSGILLSLL